MPNLETGYEELKSTAETALKGVNYLQSYSQMLALTTAYQSYILRNMAIEANLRERLAKEKRPIKVCYYVYILDQVCYPILSALQEDPRFDLKVLANDVNQLDFLRSKGYRVGLIHSRWESFPEHAEDGEPPFEADLCFSEMPYGVFPALEHFIRPWMIAGGWLPRYADIFPRYELNNSLFCMIHYAYFLADEWVWLKSNPQLNVHYSLPFPNFSWIYFLESEGHLKFAQDRNNFGNTQNYIVSGYPKYDAYLEAPQKPDNFSWTFKRNERQRIVYAPHFKRSEETLKQTCQTLLKIADSNKYEIVFKPHPVHNSTVNEFIPRFNEHPACQTVRNSDSSQYIFATTDLAIISSVSMHADGLFAGIPYITELSENNFNHIGKEVRAAAYELTPDTDLETLIDSILQKKDDPKKSERDAIRSKLLGNRGSATEKIIDVITQKLYGE